MGYSSFICDSFPLPEAGFALGCAFSAAFLGGGAAAQGKLGGNAQNYSLAYSATGGVAVLFIAFFSFYGLEPKDCEVTKTNVQLNSQIADLKEQLKEYQQRELRITPEALNQSRLLADKIQLHYISKERKDVTLTPAEGQGAFVIKYNDIDEGSTISIGQRPSSQAVRPVDAADSDLAIIEPAPVQLSSMKYLSMPTYFEIQLFLKPGER